MKKFLIMVLMVSYSLVGIGQEIVKDYSKIENLPTISLSQDTTITVDISEAQFYFDSQFIWDGLDAIDGAVEVQTSNLASGENFVTLTDWAELKLNTSSGNSKIISWDRATSCKRIRWKISHGSNTTGTIDVYINLVRKR